MSANLDHIRKKMISIYNEPDTYNYNDHINEYENTLNIYQIDINLIKQQITNFHNRPVTSIKQLYHKITNLDQASILSNLINPLKKDEVYLMDYVKNISTEKKKANLIGNFTILGSMTKKGRTEYDIKLFNSNEPKSFWCSCPDHKFNSTKKGTCCKHICMIVCKVAKILDSNFFETKKLSEEQYNSLLIKLDSREILLTENCYPSDPAFQNTKVLMDDDVCGICYDDLNVFNDTSNTLSVKILSCPCCKNCTHQTCMEVWLENKDTCVFCRSDIWKNYNKV